jgi:hypothetical protein
MESKQEDYGYEPVNIEEHTLEELYELALHELTLMTKYAMEQLERGIEDLTGFRAVFIQMIPALAMVLYGPIVKCKEDNIELTREAFPNEFMLVMTILGQRIDIEEELLENGSSTD